MTDKPDDKPTGCDRFPTPHVCHDDLPPHQDKPTGLPERCPRCGSGHDVGNPCKPTYDPQQECCTYDTVDGKEVHQAGCLDPAHKPTGTLTDAAHAEINDLERVVAEYGITMSRWPHIHAAIDNIEAIVRKDCEDPHNLRLVTCDKHDKGRILWHVDDYQFDCPACAARKDERKDCADNLRRDIAETVAPLNEAIEVARKDERERTILDIVRCADCMIEFSCNKHRCDPEKWRDATLRGRNDD